MTRTSRLLRPFALSIVVVTLVAVATAMALTGVDLIADAHLLADVQDDFTRAKAARA